MPRAIWTGSISFGLVSIPVKLYSATEQRDVRFHLFDRGSGRRIHYQRVADRAGEAAPAEESWSPSPTSSPDEPGETVEETAGEPALRQPEDRSQPWIEPARSADVAFEDVVKGYEVAPERYVMLTPDELRAVEPERTHSIDIEEFIELSEIDPLFFDKSYHVAPQRGAAAEKPYALLLEALRRTQRVAVARFVLRSKSYLAAIRPLDEVLVLHTMFFADEVRSGAAIDTIPVRVDASDREIDMAVKLIDLLSARWDPSGHRDEHRERILELIRAKAEAAGALVDVAAESSAEPPASRLPELLEALRASVEAAREASKPATGEGGGKAKTRRRTG